MLRHRRNKCIENIVWKSGLHKAEVNRYFPEKANPECVKALEAYQYEHVKDEDRDKCWRLVDLADTTQYLRAQNAWSDEFDDKVEKYLNRADDFKAPKPDHSGNLLGGFRIILCERSHNNPCMTLTRRAFEKIEESFGLHDATLPAFFDEGGSFTCFTRSDRNGAAKQMKIVVKVKHKFQIANCLLSLNHNADTRWTDCFICGDGIIRARRPNDDWYGEQAEQLLAALTQCTMDMWSNPMLLPTAILQLCVERTTTRVERVEAPLLNIETHLGVTFAGRAGDYYRERPEWPMDVDVEKATRELHSLLPKILTSEGHVQWQARYVEFLLQSEAELSRDTPTQGNKEAFNEIRSTLNLFASRIAGNIEYFGVLKGRTQSQIDLLFNVVTQRDAQMSRRANDLNLEVARATKEDSISMSTFTFITALFLPPSFVATLFSMSMFEWSSGGSTGGGSSRVSSSFWIFWAVATPLTALTMGGWFLWYGHADRKWQRRLDNVGRDSTERPDEAGSSHEMDAASPTKYRNRLHRLEVIEA